MNVAVLQLINDRYIICDLEMLEEEPCYYLKNSYEVIDNGYPKNDVKFVKYPKFTEDEGCLMHTDKIITMIDPEPRIIELYMKVIGE